MKKIDKPKEDEFAPYYGQYINMAPDDGTVLEHLKNDAKIVTDFMLSLPEEKLNYRYAEGKWTPREILGHIIDVERVFSYRALCFARGEVKSLPGFEENDYAKNSNAGERSIKELTEEFNSVRNSTLALFNSMNREMFLLKGTANNNTLSVRAIAYILTGHELHHVNVIRERYL